MFLTWYGSMRQILTRSFIIQHIVLRCHNRQEQRSFLKCISNPKIPLRCMAGFLDGLDNLLSSKFRHARRILAANKKSRSLVINFSWNLMSMIWELYIIMEFFNYNSRCMQQVRTQKWIWKRTSTVHRYHSSIIDYLDIKPTYVFDPGHWTLVHTQPVQSIQVPIKHGKHSQACQARLRLRARGSSITGDHIFFFIRDIVVSPIRESWALSCWFVLGLRRGTDTKGCDKKKCS